MDNSPLLPKWFSIDRESNKLTLSLYIQPGAKKTTISGLYGDALKIKLAAQAQDNKANEALLRYLALFFKVPLSQKEIKKGDKSRHKEIKIEGSSIDPLLILKKSS